MESSRKDLDFNDLRRTAATGADARGTGLRRLDAVAALVPPGAVVVDIGADHGRLGVHLLRAGHIARYLAVERTPRAAAALEALAASPSCPPGLALRIGDGLAALDADDRPDVAVLAGLGGSSILRILAEATTRTWRRLILQPQSDVAAVRAWSRSTGLGIVDERWVLDRRRGYTVIALEPGAPVEPPPPGLTLADVDAAGPVLLGRREVAVRDHWRGETVAWEAILAEAARGGGEADQARRRLERARRILEVLERDPC